MPPDYPPLRLKGGGVLTRDMIPEANAGLARLEVDLPALSARDTESRLQFENDLVEYIRREGEDISRTDLRFLRSAMLNDRKCWIWEFTTRDGDRCYATVTIEGRSQTLGYDADWDGLSPEQFLVSEYFECR